MSEYLARPEHDISQAVERLAAETSASFRQFWLDRGEYAAEHDLGRVNEREYYRSARMFSESIGGNPSYTRLLANYEIHRGGETSPEFRLFSDVMISDLTLDMALIEHPTQLKNYLLEVHTGDEESNSELAKLAVVKAWYDRDPLAFKRLLLTRELCRYTPLKVLLKNSGGRHVDPALELEMIEKMVRDGITPLTPEEYHQRVKTYLLGLIKSDEARLNPVTPDTSLPPMQGSIAIQSYFESRDGVDFPLPKSS